MSMVRANSGARPRILETGECIQILGAHVVQQHETDLPRHAVVLGSDPKVLHAWELAKSLYVDKSGRLLSVTGERNQNQNIVVREMTGEELSAVIETGELDGMFDRYGDCL